MTDGLLVSTSTLTLASIGVNDAPTAVNDTKTLVEDTTATGNVLSNDSDIDGDTLSVASFSVGGTTYLAGQTANLASGLLTILANGAYTFVPAANWTGSVPAVTVTITDGSLTATSTLGLTVTGVNDAVTTADDSLTINENTVGSGNVLTNDVDVDGNAMRVSGIIVNGTLYTVSTTGVRTVTIAGKGTVTMAANGAYTYAPVENGGAFPAITVRVTDGLLVSTSTLTLAVAPPA